MCRTKPTSPTAKSTKPGLSDATFFACCSHLIVQFFHDFFQLGANHSEEANNKVTAERQFVGRKNITITSLNLIATPVQYDTAACLHKLSH